MVFKKKSPTFPVENDGPVVPLKIVLPSAPVGPVGPVAPVAPVSPPPPDGIEHGVHNVPAPKTFVLDLMKDVTSLLSSEVIIILYKLNFKCFG